MHHNEDGGIIECAHASDTHTHTQIEALIFNCSSSLSTISSFILITALQWLTEESNARKKKLLLWLNFNHSLAVFYEVVPVHSTKQNKETNNQTNKSLWCSRCHRWWINNVNYERTHPSIKSTQCQRWRLIETSDTTGMVNNGSSFIKSTQRHHSKKDVFLLMSSIIFGTTKNTTTERGIFRSSNTQ